MKPFQRTIIGGLLACAVTLAANASQAADISGAGSTFAYPIFAKWADAYKTKAGVGMNYQSIGSGGGIKQIQAKTVDFGASDAPLKAEDLDKFGLVQWPQIIGGIVPVINVKGIEAGKLKLTGVLLADIYMGKITKWNDKALAALNPDLKLPDQAIAPVYRSDGSGTTYNFADYLAKVSPEWKDKIGVNTSIQFPVGLGGKGNEGVAAFTSRTDGAIGYVEYAYAKQNKMTYVSMQNKDGAYVLPTAAAFQAAAANADWAHAQNYYLILTDQPGKESWPITASTFVLMYKKQDKPDVGKSALEFFKWSFENGQKMAEELDYIPMPENVVKLIENTTWGQITDGSKPIL
ncbi:MAG TPA: phosphate ABC transporter substrate-binding protein PstS [Stellaceae bacterium]|nr:phosphate ABC transporter substrate-binding protein PstS [Stellaceae bacterium]